jgi:small GTP-binding protein
MPEKANYIFKIIILGDASVGKTSLISRYIKNSFDTRTNQTIGIQFNQRMIKIDQTNIMIQLWDTAGQERYRAITRHYYHGSHAVLLCFDMSELSTMYSVESWIKDIKSFGLDNVPYLIVGTKSDLTDIANLEKINEFIRKLSAENEIEIDFIPTSAYSGYNIIKVFEDISRKTLNETLKKNSIVNETDEKIKLDSDQKTHHTLSCANC